MLLLFLLLLSAMSSYLFIIKSELPLVIQSFLKNEASNEWETAVKVITALMDPLCRGVDFMFLEYWLLSSVCLTVFFCREWFLNGNILIIIVSIFIILPLAIMKQLGMFSILSSHFFFLHTVCFVAFCQVHFHVLFFLKKKFLLFTVTDFIVDSVIFSSTVLQVTWVTQVASPCPAWCSFSYRWVRRSTQTN